MKRGLITIGAAAVSIALLGSSARAQEAKPEAQALYDQATTEMDAGKYESACKKLEEVVRLIPDGIGAKLTLAQCYEGVDRLASAWSQYIQVEVLSRKSKQAARAKKAAQKAASLKDKLAKLTIDVPAAARSTAGIEIVRDGEVIGEAQWGVALPADKGSHAVTARAPGYKAWSGSVTIEDNGKAATITVPALEAEPEKPAPVAAPAPAPAPSSPAPPDAAKKRAWQRPVGFAALGVGVAGLAAGGAFGGLALTRFGESKDAGCKESGECPAAAIPVRNEARLFGDISTIAIIAGGALSVGGLVLVITAPSKEKSAAQAQRESGRSRNKEAMAPPQRRREASVTVELAPLFGGAAVRGAF